MAGAGIVRVSPSERPFRPLAIMAGVLGAALTVGTVAYNQQNLMPTEGQKSARVEIEKDITRNVAEIRKMTSNDNEYAPDYRVMIISQDVDNLNAYGPKYIGKERLQETETLIQTMADAGNVTFDQRRTLGVAKWILEHHPAI